MASSAAQLTCSALNGDQAVCENFGGLRIWAPNDVVYREGLEELKIGIETALDEHSSLDKAGLLFMLGELIGERIDKNVVGAILGAELRCGRVEEVLCASLSNKVFRIYVGVSVRERFHDRIRASTELLRAKRHIKVSELRDLFFTQAPGTWTQASHLLAHMVFHGTAVYVDKYKAAWPTGLENAFR